MLRRPRPRSPRGGHAAHAGESWHGTGRAGQHCASSRLMVDGPKVNSRPQRPQRLRPSTPDRTDRPIISPWRRASGSAIESARATIRPRSSRSSPPGSNQSRFPDASARTNLPSPASWARRLTGTNPANDTHIRIIKPSVDAGCTVQQSHLQGALSAIGRWSFSNPVIPGKGHFPCHDMINSRHLSVLSRRSDS